MARGAVDVGLAYAYLSGAGMVTRGTVLAAEGHAVSSGLILTATLNNPAGLSGATQMAAGRGLMGVGGMGAGGAAVNAPPGLSLWPVNAITYLNEGGAEACSAW